MRLLTRYAVGLSVFIGGAVLMSLEVAAFRIIGRTFGSALRETTTVIAVFLVAMSIGYWLGGRLGDWRPRLATLAGVFVVAAATLLLVPQLDRALSDSISASGNLSLHAFFATTLFFAIPTVALAMVSPIAIRLFAHDTARAGSVAGSISALSTVGSVVGSVATAFVLIDLLGSINRTVLLLGAFAAMMALIVIVADTSPRVRMPFGERCVGATSGMLVLISILPFIASTSGGVPLTSEGTKVLFSRDSAYHQITVLDRPAGERDLVIDSTLQSRMYRGDTQERGLRYAEHVHVARLMRPDTRRVLFIGLGGGTLPKQFTRFYDDTVVDVVEIDPLVATTAREFFGVKESDRLRVHIGDGRVFLKRQEAQYDLISIDAYTRGKYGATIPPHLVTTEFFQEVARKLSKDGIVHIHSYAPRQNPFCRSLYRTLQSVFPSVVVLGETEFFASALPLPSDIETLTERAAAVRHLLPQIDDRIATVGHTIPDSTGVLVLRDDYAPVDTLLRQNRLLRVE